MKITVCDAIMGKGKTQSAITMMNENTDRRFIFVSPFLDETERICQACPGRNFVKPTVYSNGNKLDCLNKYLKEGKNIASTHALFYRYNEETLHLVRDGGYTLIMDETIDVVDFLGITASDVNLLFKHKVIETAENGRVIRRKTDYSGIFNPLLNDIDDSFVTCENNQLLVWKMPLEFFSCFEDVIILTYMFDVQPQYYYYKMHGVDINYIGTEYVDGVYRFTETKNANRIKLPPIHILEDSRLNEIGDDHYALSMNWFEKNKHHPDKPEFKTLKDNIYNIFSNKFKSHSKDNLWTTYKDFQNSLKGRGYTKGYLPFNTRATNDWRERTCLAYCVNVFMPLDVKNYFIARGYSPDEDGWALSSMIQWIWRSAVRDGKEIWLYVPSRRMRELLKGWINEVSIADDDNAA